jgi:LmbE family N-acetylglucosaminyl deacetylase
MTDSVAVIAAHPDDEVLGCGGTLARMALEGRKVHILLVADGETSRFGNGNAAGASAFVATRHMAAESAREVLGCTSVEVLSLPDNRLDRFDLLDLVKHFESFLRRHRPSTLLTHHAGDVNIDHRLVHEAAIAACRPSPGTPINELLFFEIPSSTEWRPAGSAHPFVPNWFVDISGTMEKKMRALEAYQSEMRPFPHPRSARAVEALARWRGASAGLEAAEAFVLGRNIVKRT